MAADDKTDLEKTPVESTGLTRPGYPRTLFPEAYGDGYGYGESSDKMDLRELWRILRKRKWLAITVAVIITTVVTIVSFQSKSIYQASATIEMEQENHTLVRSGDVVVQTDDDSDFNPGEMKTKIRLLESRPLLEDVVTSLNLDKNPRFMDVNTNKSIMDSIRTIGSKFHVTKQAGEPQPAKAVAIELKGEGARSPEESARLASSVAVLQAHLTAEPLEDTRMLVVSYSHTDPELAASVVNTMAQVFIARSFENSTEKFTKTSQWLDGMTRDLEGKVEAAEQDVANYTREHNLFSVDGKETLSSDKLSQLFTQATKAESDRVLRESLYEEVKAGRIDQLPEAFTDPKTAELQRKMGELSVQAAHLGAKYGPDNPNMIQIKQELDAVKAQIADSRGELEAKLKADYERAARDEKSIKEELAAAKAEAVDQNEASIGYNLLKQKLETAKQLYSDFLQKRNQAAVQVAEQHNTMRVIEPAAVPGAPVGPNRLRTISIGGFLSLLAGFGLGFLLEYVDNTIKTVEDVNRYAQLPALGVIPAISNRESRRLSGRKKAPRPINSPITPHPEIRSEPVQMVASDNRSSAAEAYRGLRTSVLLSAAGGPPKVVMFTSGQPGEGKTTTVINTAISLAQLGSSVVIVDADLRKPGTHKVFGLKHTLGLSSYLSGDKIELEKVIHKLSIPNLSLIPCGPIPPNPSELVSSEKMKNMLAELSAKYDHVLIDSPPLIHVTDPVILSTLVDGVILVVHGGRSTREIVRRARQELSAVGAKVFGVVLNNLDLKREGYEDYYYYSYYSVYGRDQEGAHS
ncbi:MAG TPA: polysaccharide biosynthesis tyrosine autokinase [Blastocatellia bacterium]